MPYTTPRRNAKQRFGARTPRSAYKARGYKYRTMRAYGTGKRLGVGRNFARHSFVRSTYQQNFITLTGGTSNTIWDFALGFCASNIVSQTSVPGTIPTGPNTPTNSIADFQNLFEEYRITNVKVTLIPHFDNSDLLNANISANDPQMIPQIYYVYDSDDVAPIPMPQLMQMQGVKMHFDRSPLVMNFKPKPQQLMAGGVGGGTAIAERPASNKLWLDMDAVNTPYYGIKFNIRTGDFPSGITMAWDVKVDYSFQCRGIR